MALHSTAPVCAQSSYDSERLAYGSMVVGLHSNGERSPKVASGRKDGTKSNNTCICPITSVFKF